jgi:hypothetical protein
MAHSRWPTNTGWRLKISFASSSNINSASTRKDRCWAFGVGGGGEGQCGLFCGWHWPYPLWREGLRWPFCQAPSIPYSQLKPFSAPLPPSIHPSPRLPFSCHNFPFALDQSHKMRQPPTFPPHAALRAAPGALVWPSPIAGSWLSCAAARHRHWGDSSMVAVAAASMAHSNCSRIYLPVGRGLPPPLPLFPFFPQLLFGRLSAMESTFPFSPHFPIFPFILASSINLQLGPILDSKSVKNSLGSFLAI